MIWISIDPGDIHVGFASWHDDECLRAVEMTPNELISHLETVDPAPGFVICERFLLYGWLAAQQVGSEFKTAQLIGAIKLLCRQRDMVFVGQTASEGKMTYRRKPWSEWRSRAWKSYGHGGHAKDAEAHGYAYLWGLGIRPQL